ncbi:MAG: hypothetical protein PHE52_01185 [Candidatus Pacebacteria bacterium]|nr:hypothetical protein [Candidatus Paceibacterota bacterium]
MKKKEKSVTAKFLNNLKGKLKGCPDCSNCGDSFLWKPCTTVFNFLQPGGLVVQVSFCDECLADPKKLDIARIKKNLMKKEKYSWLETEKVGDFLSSKFKTI